MAYSYQIQFVAAGYNAVIPTNNIILEGGWETGTMIWREKIGSFKIGRNKNSTIYDTLESWFDDKTKFASRIYIKILKNNVEDSIHWFGVKWGTINEHLKTYTVQPIPYDFWGQYFEHTKDLIYKGAVPGTDHNLTYYNTTGTYPYINGQSIDALIQTIKTFATENSSWLDTDIVSSFLNQDNYEGGGAVGTFRGMPLDYVTGEQSYLDRGGFDTLTGYSFSDLLRWFTLLRTFVFFDSNDKLRFEHIKFFNDKLTDNAVDFSSYIKNYDDEWNYEEPNIPVLESLSMKEGDDDTDDDFNKIDIIYSNITNRPDSTSIDFISDLYSNIKHLGTPAAVGVDLILFSGFANHVYKLFNSTMNTFSSDGNSFDVTWDVGDVCWSQDFRAESEYHQFTFTAEIASITGSFAVTIYSRASGGLSSSLTVNSTGTTSGTLTISSAGAFDDAYLRIVSLSGSAAAGWITLTDATTSTNSITPTVDGIVSGTPQTNGAMSMANIFDRWWQDDRMAHSGTFDSTPYTFDGTIYNLRRKTMNFYYADAINPLYGFNDGDRVGRIDKWKHKLDSGEFYEIDVIYQEDD